MATPTFDMSWLPLAEATVGAMVAQGNSSFVGAQPFNCTWGKLSSAQQLGLPATMTTAQVQQRLIALRFLFDTIAL